MQRDEMGQGAPTSNEIRTVLFGVGAVLIVSGLIAWLAGRTWLRWSVDQLLVVEFALLVMVLLVGLCLLAVTQISSTAEALAAQSEVTTEQDGEDDRVQQFSPRLAAQTLVGKLRDRDGWFWRSRSQLVLVAGDVPVVRRLVPGLVDSGYSITGDAVLLYAKQTSNSLDTDWLEQIRRMCRFRPVDAIVTEVGS